MKRKDNSSSAADMQEANATGARNNEQGRASFTTGATTGGGSNYGQGSSHLGGRQGDTTNTGSNYDNEAGRLGSSAVGTNNEGSSSPVAGAEESGNSAGPAGDKPSKEVGLADAGLESDAGRSADESTSSEENGRRQSGSWSQGSTSGG